MQVHTVNPEGKGVEEEKKEEVSVTGEREREERRRG